MNSEIVVTDNPVTQRVLLSQWNTIQQKIERQNHLNDRLHNDYKQTEEKKEQELKNVSVFVPSKEETMLRTETSVPVPPLSSSPDRENSKEVSSTTRDVTIAPTPFSRPVVEDVEEDEDFF